MFFNDPLGRVCKHPECELLTSPVTVGDGENSVIAVENSDHLAGVRRRCLVDVMFQNTGTVSRVAECQQALRPRDNEVVSRHGYGSVERVRSQVHSHVDADDAHVGDG